MRANDFTRVFRTASDLNAMDAGVAAEKTANGGDDLGVERQEKAAAPTETAKPSRNKFSVSKVASPPPPPPTDDVTSAPSSADGASVQAPSEPPAENGHTSGDDTQWRDSKKAAFFLGHDVADTAPAAAAIATAVAPVAQNAGDDGDKQKSTKEFKVTKVGFDVGGDAPGDHDATTDGDVNSKVTSPHSPTNSYMTQNYDTHNLKTFGQDTLETLPNMDHYRNLLSATGHMRKRPTLAELHDLDVSPLAQVVVV